MLSFLSRVLLLLTVATSLTGQTKISDLTELATTPASTDILVIVDIGSPNVTKKITVSNFLSSLDADNIDTGDLAAARMSANWGTAGTSACATSGGVMFDDGAAVGCDAALVYASSASLLSSGSLTIRDSDVNQASLDIYSAVNGATNAHLIWSAQNASGTKKTIGAILGLFDDRTAGSEDGRLRFFTLINGSAAEIFQLGGTSQTALIQDTTATTGDTLFICKGGAGETGNCLEIQDNAGTTNFGIDEDGFANQTGVEFANLGSPSNGTWIYCSDCEQTNGATDNTCTSSGTGAFAFRVNSTWRCVGSEGP